MAPKYSGRSHELRPVKDIIAQMVALYLLAFLVLMLCYFFRDGMVFDRETPRLWFDYSQEIGRVLVEHIGWYLSVTIQTCLALYIVVVGGQLAGGDSEIQRIRRALSNLAITLSVAAGLTSFFVVSSSLRTAADFGTLLPVSAANVLIFVLAIGLGEFGFFETSLKLKALKETQAAAQTLLESLHDRTTRVDFTLSLLGRGIAGAALVAAASAAASFYGFDVGWGALLVYLALCFLAATGLGFVLAKAKAATLVLFKSTGWDRAESLMVSLTFAIGAIGLVVYFWIFASEAAGTLGGFFAALLFLAAVLTEYFLNPRFQTRSWALDSLAHSLAYRQQNRIHERVSREIELIEPDSSLATRVGRAISRIVRRD
ncbi:hypothetical protein NYA9BBAC_00612 [Salinibacterium sp. NYA9b]